MHFLGFISDLYRQEAKLLQSHTLTPPEQEHANLLYSAISSLDSYIQNPNEEIKKYLNSNILCVNRNYCSTTQIFGNVQSFVSQNKNTYEKNIISECGNEDKASLISVDLTKTQHERFAKKDYIRRYNEVKERFIQQETPIKDSSGQRWVQCEICHKIKETTEFSSYGGDKRVNLGKCSKCSRN